MIAQEVCKEDPERFVSLTLLSTIAGGPYSLYLFLLTLPTGIQLLVRANLTTNWKLRLKHFLNLLYPDSFLSTTVVHPQTKQVFSNYEVLRKTMIRRAIEEKNKGMKPVNLSTIIKQVLAVTTHHVTESELKNIAKKLNGNVLVVTGDEDILVHPKNSEKLNNALNCQFLSISGAGHGAFEQSHEEINQAIEKLVRRSRL